MIGRNEKLTRFDLGFNHGVVLSFTSYSFRVFKDRFLHLVIATYKLATGLF